MFWIECLFQDQKQYTGKYLIIWRYKIPIFLTLRSSFQALERPFQVLKTLGPEAIGVLITDGDGGVSYAFEKVGGRMDAFAVPCVDSTGCP